MPIATPTSGQRAENTAFKRAVTRSDLDAALGILSRDELHSLLREAAEYNPTLSDAIAAQVAQHRRQHLAQQEQEKAEAQRVVSFDKYYDYAHSALVMPVDDSGPLGNMIIEVMLDGFKEIAESVKPYSSFSTKLNALETMRKMCHAILTEEGDVARAARSKIASEEVIQMVKVCRTLSDAERAGFHDAEPAFIRRFEKLVAHAEMRQVFVGVRQVLEILA